MQPGLCAVIDGIYNTRGDESEAARYVDDNCAVGLALEVVQKANGKVHGPSNVDIDFLVCLAEIELLYLQGPLDPSIVDEAVDVRVIIYDSFDEGGDGGDVTGIERLGKLSVC